jgi:hypothetical protein
MSYLRAWYPTDPEEFVSEIEQAYKTPDSMPQDLLKIEILSVNTNGAVLVQVDLDEAKLEQWLAEKDYEDWRRSPRDAPQRS